MLGHVFQGWLVVFGAEFTVYPGNIRMDSFEVALRFLFFCRELRSANCWNRLNAG